MRNSPQKFRFKDGNPALSTDFVASPSDAVTVDPSQEGEDGMGVRSMTVGRYEEIRRRLAEGRGIREIARALSCSRDTVREVRDGRRPGNPMLRYVGGADQPTDSSAAVASASLQETLKL